MLILMINQYQLNPVKYWDFYHLFSPIRWLAIKFTN